MSFSIVTWNINSVRLRMPLVEKLVKKHQPDVICFQEIKCQDDQFPQKSFEKLGYEYQAVHGQKSYHGVATVSKRPLTNIEKIDFCKMGDARHISADLEAGGKTIKLHNFYVPAGGDEPDTKKNPKFDHKLKFINEMKQLNSNDKSIPAILVGDLNIAPLETDVWSHKQLLKVVSHTPIETDNMKELIKKGDWVDLIRHHIPPEELVYTWWSYRARDWKASNRGRRLDHIWGAEELSNHLKKIEVYSDARDWEKASDHAPVFATFDLH